MGVYLCITEFEGFDGSYTMNNIAIIGIAIGGILATCSREKVEDEMISHIRLNALLIALYVNYAILIVCSLLVYDFDFVQVMIYQMFTILLVFMFIFRSPVGRLQKGAGDEE